MPQTSSHPWAIDAREFPRAGPPEEQLAFALRYAILAPSAHNTQPWRFRVVGDMVEVHADRTRVLPIADPAERELLISCGAALFFLRITLRRFGHAPTVALQPDAERPSLVASVWLGEPAEPTPDEAVLAEAIIHRHTNRRAFEDRPVPSELTLALVRAAASEGAWLEAVIDPERRRSLAGLVAQAHAEQLADEAFVGELASWVRDPAADDGMPTHGVPLAEVGAPHASAFLRTFEAAAGAAETEAQLAAGSPLLAVLGTTEDDEAGVAALRRGTRARRCCGPAPRVCPHPSSTSRSRSPRCGHRSPRRSATPVTPTSCCASASETRRRRRPVARSRTCWTADDGAMTNSNASRSPIGGDRRLPSRTGARPAVGLRRD